MRRWAVAGLAVATVIIGACTVGRGARSERVERSEELATVDHPVTSPSGQYVLHVQEANTTGDDAAGELRFVVETPDGAVEYEADRTFSPRFRTYFLWDDADRVWVYSSDVGTYIWERGDDGTWASRTWRGSGLDAPPFLVAAVPKRFAG